MSIKKHKNTRYTIGLLSRDLGFQLFLGAVQAAREQDANLFCFLGETINNPDHLLMQSNIAYDLADPQRLDALALWGGSGAAVGMHLDQSEMARFIQQYASIPVVNYERKIEGIPVILTDVYQGMCEAVRHLIEIHQCRKIALIWGPAGHFETEERVRAYRDTLAEYNLPVNPKLISAPVSWTSVGGAQAMEDLIRESMAHREQSELYGLDFDAVLTTDCSQAAGALGMLQQRGIKVPEDVVVLGFDERDDSRLTSPPLTTVKKPFFEVGKRLIETAVEAASGKAVPEYTHVPTQLVVRRSCGCIDPAIMQASLDKTQASQEKFDIIINTRRANFLAEIAHGMQAAVPESDPARIQRMVESFVNELVGETTAVNSTAGGFARALDDFMQQEIADTAGEMHSQHPMAGDGGNLLGGRAVAGELHRSPPYCRSQSEQATFDGSNWQNMISAMQRRMLPNLDGKKRTQADALWNQARISIGASAQRFQAYQAFLSEQRAQILREIDASVSTTFNLEALANSLAEGLPRLGIPSCYLSLYEEPLPYKYPQPAPEWSRLVLAYTENGRIGLEKDRRRFRSRQLVPDGLLPQNRQFNYLVFPLYFGEEQQGFLLLEVGPREAMIYQALIVQIAGALHGSLLVKRVEERAIRLIEARQQAEDALRESELLYTSLVENMNFNVFRKDLDGRYTYANDAFCKALNTTLVKLLGKTDYDFSPKETADKYRSDDAKVIATGKPIEIIEEHVLTDYLETNGSAPDTRGSSVRYIQTLKAPVRNTRGDIIGIQGAFWDISDQRRAEYEVERRAVQLQTASEISRAASSLLDVNELTQQAVDLICNRFNLYYVGLFLVDQSGGWTGEAGRWAFLRAGSGEAGQKMLSQGHKLEIGGASMVGWCVAKNTARITLDTSEVTDTDIMRFKNPLLPETRSEMALPLTSRGQMLGALSIQSTQRDAFSNEDIAILQSMADQLANAIANASLYEQTQNALREMETIYRRYLVQGWSEFSKNRSASGYRWNENEVTPLGVDLLPEVQHAMSEQHPATLTTDEEGQPTLVVPIKLRDTPIGAIGLKAKEEKRQWSEDEISLIEILSEQFALAAENIRLLEETQRRAEREHLVSEITTRLRVTNDPQAILQTAASELRRALNAKNARVFIKSTDEVKNDPYYHSSQ